MGHTLAVWRALEDLLVELRKKDVQIPVNILEDLRSARSMIELSYSEDTPKDAVTKAEVYITNVETYLIGQAQEIFEPTQVDEWLNRIIDANLQVDKETPAAEGRFVVGVPRDQKWFRIEPDENLPEDYVFKLAKEWNLTVSKQTNGRLMVHGQLNDVKAFIKHAAAKLNPKT
jgi:hypothetical protein